MGISLKPSDAVTGGGGLLDDIDVTITRCRFRTWDYNGQLATPGLGLEVTFEDEEGNETNQVYSAGDLKHFTPSDDGTEANQIGTMPSLSESTNAVAFIRSLVNAGYPEDKVTDKVTVFEGTKVHVNQAPQPVRKGLQQKAGKTVLLVSKIHSFPWDSAAKAGAPVVTKGKAPVASKAKATVTVAAAAGNGEDLNAKGVETLIGIVMAKGGSVAKSAIAQEAFKALATDPARNQLVQLIYKDEFLKQAGAPWAFDGATVSMG